MVLVTTGRSPFEVAVLAAATISGAVLFASDARPRSVAESMPPLVQGIWEATLLVAGLAGLIGVYWPGDIPTGLGVELGAVIVLGTSMLMYTIALFAVGGWQALAVGMFIAAIGLGSCARATQISRDLLRLTRSEAGRPPC